MKKIFFLVTFIALCMIAESQSLLNNAIEKAKKEHRFVLLNFSGSDWCIPCIQMQKEYFENDAFKKMADSQLVIVRADFPRKKKNLPAKEIVAQNEQIAEKFNADGIFPLTLLFDDNQQIIRRWEGKPDENVADFITGIITIINKQK